MLHQKEILQWLKMFSVSQIKHFLTIKNAEHLDYVNRILNYKPENKPKDIWTFGFSEQSINNQTSIYMRDKFRHKKEKDKKKLAEDCLFENITVSRKNPHSLSVKKEFIRNGKLSECMSVLSEGQIFNSITANYSQSAWFQKSNINSFSMWVVRLFELEIFQAYYTNHKEESINQFVYAEEHITRELVQQMLESCISKLIEKTSRSPKSKGENNEEGKELLQVKKEEGPYLLKLCLDKLEEEGREVGEIVFEDIWCIADRTCKVSRVYIQLSDDFMQKYKEYVIDVKCLEIEEKANKKRKKKAKKPKEDHSQLIESKPELTIRVETQIKQPKIKQQVSNTLKQSKTSNQLESKLILKAKKEESKPILVEKQKQRKNIKETQQPKWSQQKIIEQRQKQEQRKAKKIVSERINENIQGYYDQLYEASQNFDKYRKICFQIIKNTIEELKIPTKWKLELFGSASIDFALKQSDLDLVLIIDSEKSCSLIHIFEMFKVKEWLRACNLIPQAKVPIVEFEVLLSQIKNAKYKESKRIMNSVIHVDISISYKSKPHEGLQNTQFLQQIFEDHPNLRVVCLILKELLRVNELNKPYKGGIGSYVLVILVHNILKLKCVEFQEDLIRQLKAVSKYMSSQFQPFVTLVTPFKNSKVAASSELSLNIEDPHERVLLHTSARLINEIISLFKQLHSTLDAIESQLGATNIQERKKMKKIFFENWNMLFEKDKEEESDLSQQ